MQATISKLAKICKEKCSSSSELESAQSNCEGPTQVQL